MNAECSEDDDMIAIERQLAARASRSSDTVSAQLSHHKSLTPTPDSSVAQVPANPHKDKQPSPLPPSSPQESDNEGLARKWGQVRPAHSPTPDAPVNSHENVLPAHSPTPNPPVNPHKHKQASASIAAIFDDDTPLTEEDEEVIQPTKRK
ncbi:hypothetical protein BD769DRAFT_1382414 [Suillus cothurnatus]|nr:hypothetical protein BD769DRAFT_1382414 [Suillus cothurnatus]